MKQSNNTATTSTKPSNPTNLSIILNHNVIKPTNTYTFFRLHPLLSPILNYISIIIQTNRAYRTFKRKLPNQTFPSKPGIARDYINHPDHQTLPIFFYYLYPSSLNIHIPTPTLTRNNLTLSMSMY